MYLVIDNSNDEKLIIHTYLNTKWVHAELELKGISLLAGLENFCISVGLKLADLKGLGVVVGRGRFTATRVATTTANTLALALNLPVVAITEFNETVLDLLTKAAPKNYITPVYSGAANIGQPK